MDLIGCANVCSDFAVIGTSNEQLYGMCEALWKQPFRSSLERRTLNCVVDSSNLNFI